MKNGKIYIGSHHNKPLIYLAVDLSVRSIKWKVQQLWDIDCLLYDDINDSYCAEITEERVVAIVKAFGSYKTIAIDEQLQQYYSIITGWNKRDIIKQFDITDEVISLIQAEIGDVELNPCILADRSIRYQYNKVPVEGNSLINMIANRTSVSVWVDNNVYTLDELVQTLIKLQRLPILITYDIRHQSLNFVDELINVMGPNIVDKIILNSQTIVDTADKIVIVSKFTPRLLDTEWIPKSVISYNSSLRNCKTAIYANKCDLRISYTTTKPLIKTKTY